MTHALKSLAIVGAMLFAIGSIAPADAATNQAVLNVSATVTNNCDVLTQPGGLTMGYSPVQNVATAGTASFTYACTNGALVSVTPTSPNVAGGSNWDMGAPYFLYTLWNSLTCTTGQLTNGTAESLGNDGSSQTYNICAIPNLGQQTIPVGVYQDTVTFTFNFGP